VWVLVLGTGFMVFGLPYPVSKEFGGGIPLELWGFANRRCVELDGMPVWFSPPELVIIRKLEHFREGGSAITKHLNDIRSVLVCTDVDRVFIEEHVARMGLQEPWLACLPS